MESVNITEIAERFKEIKIDDSLELIRFKDEDIKYIEQWENNKEIFNYLTHSRPRYIEENDLKAKENILFFMIRFDNKIIGTTWIEDINEEDTLLSIYLGDTSQRGNNIGKKVIKTLCDIAFKELKLKEVHLNVREKNIRAMSCYKSCRFEITKEFPKRNLIDGSYQGSYRMTLKNNL